MEQGPIVVPDACANTESNGKANDGSQYFAKCDADG
jgi:hypothetical protein